MSLVNIIIYTIVIYIIIFAIRSEKLDLFCPKEYSKEYDCKECGDGKGKYYIDGKGNLSDSPSVLLDKIILVSKYQENTVKWRRSIVLAFIICILFSLLVLRRFMEGYELVISMFTIFIIIYQSYSYYQFHYDRYPEFYIKKNVEYLRKKFDLGIGNDQIVI